MATNKQSNKLHLENKAGESATLQIVYRRRPVFSETSRSSCHNINCINTSTIFEFSNVFTLKLRLPVVAQSVLCPSLVRSHFSFGEGSVSVTKQTNKTKQQQKTKENNR